MSKKVFITGATGLVGSHLCRALLAKDYEVTALKREDSALGLIEDCSDKIQWKTGDILDYMSLQEAIGDEVEQVFHCAAMISFQPKDFDNMKAINVDGTANMVNVALEKGIQKFGFVSSVAAIGRPESKHRLNEATKWEKSKFNTHYAKSKFQAEMEVWRGVAEGLSAIVINPSTIMGEGDWSKGSSKLFKTVDEGLSHYPTGNIALVDIQDVVRHFIHLMESDITNERFIINGGHLTYKSFFEKISKIIGAKPPQRKAHSWMGEIKWRWEKLKSLLFGTHSLFSKETARQSYLTYEYSNQKIKHLLGDESAFEAIDTTLERVGKAYLKQKNNI